MPKIPFNFGSQPTGPVIYSNIQKTIQQSNFLKIRNASPTGAKEIILVWSRHNMTFLFEME